MTTSQIYTYLTVCRCLSFTEAATSLNLTQSAVSRQISGLESELGFRLLERNNNILALTPAGERIRDGFAEVSGSLESVISEARRISSGVQNILRIGQLDDQVISEEVGRAIRHLTNNEHVNITVTRLEPHKLYQLLREGELDVMDMIIHPDSLNPSFASLVYQQHQPQFLLARSDLLEEIPQRATRQWLARLSRRIPIYLPDPGESHWPRPKLFSAEDIPSASYRDVDSIALMTAVGLCATVANRDNLLAQNPNITLVEIPSSPPVSRCLLWQRDNRNPMVAKLIAAVREQMDPQA